MILLIESQWCDMQLLVQLNKLAVLFLIFRRIENYAKESSIYR